MNTLLQIALLLGVTSAIAAAPGPVPPPAGSHVIDPLVDVVLPNGPGSREGQEQSTHMNCALVERRNGLAAANLTWTWGWLPTRDALHDGEVSGSDACPCAWRLKTTRVEYAFAGEPLDC
jgi:hypothetical protein